MTLPDWATKVTPLSKTIALGMLGGLPFLGFMLGMTYQKKITIYPVRGSEIKIVSIQRKDTVEDLLHRCGDFPDNKSLNNNGMFTIQGIMWSPDCRYIAWVQQQSSGPTGWLGEDVDGIESSPVDTSKDGLWLYNDKTGGSKIIIPHKNSIEVMELLGWDNYDRIRFKTGDNIVVYSLNSGGVVLYGE